MSFGIILFVATIVAVCFRYHGKIEGWWKGGEDKEKVVPRAKEVVNIKDRKRNNKGDDDDSDEEEVDSGDAFEKWMAVLEQKKNSVIRGSIDLGDVEAGEVVTTSNPLHRSLQPQSNPNEKRSSLTPGRDQDGDRDSESAIVDSPVVVGSLSSGTDVNMQSIYKDKDDTDVVVMRRLSQEVGTSESIQEVGRRASLEKSISPEGNKDDRQKALMRSAMASQGGPSGRRPSVLSKRGSTLGGRGMLRKSTKYVPPTPITRFSEVNEAEENL